MGRLEGFVFLTLSKTVPFPLGTMDGEHGARERDDVMRSFISPGHCQALQGTMRTFFPLDELRGPERRGEAFAIWKGSVSHCWVCTETPGVGPEEGTCPRLRRHLWDRDVQTRTHSRTGLPFSLSTNPGCGRGRPRQTTDPLVLGGATIPSLGRGGVLASLLGADLTLAPGV